MSVLPDVLKLKPLPSVSSMSIHTDILDPATISKTHARFVFERRGILDVNSCVQVAAVSEAVPASLAAAAYFPMKTGVHALVKSALLRCGSVVLAQTDEYARYFTMRNQFKTQEERVGRDFNSQLIVDGCQPDNQGTGKYQPVGCEWSIGAPQTGGTLPFQKITADETTTPTGTIKLSQLFPTLMKNLQLPLYLMNERVVLELTFNEQPNTGPDTQGTIGLFPAGHAASYGLSVATTQVKFLADYLTYDGDDGRMEEVAKLVMSPQGLTIPYDDVAVTTTTVPASTVNPQRITREVGMVGKQVKNITWCDQKQQGGKVVKSNQLGDYVSRASWLPSSYNLRVNDMRIFNRDVERESRQQDELAAVMGVPINVANSEYSWDTAVSKGVAGDGSSAAGAYVNPRWSANTVNGFAGDTGIAVGDGAEGQYVREGMSHYNGVSLITDPNLQTGTMVGQKPIQIERNIARVDNGNGGTDTEAFNTIFWTQYGRVMNIHNGVVSVAG